MADTTPDVEQVGVPTIARVTATAVDEVLSDISGAQVVELTKNAMQVRLLPEALPDDAKPSAIRS
jgi:hypothetical protein